jgi:hypothetical protein
MSKDKEKSKKDSKPVKKQKGKDDKIVITRAHTTGDEGEIVWGVG